MRLSKWVTLNKEFDELQQPPIKCISKAEQTSVPNKTKGLKPRTDLVSLERNAVVTYQIHSIPYEPKC